MRTARFARCCRWGRGCMAIEPHATPHGLTSPPRRPRSLGRLPPPALPCGRRPPDSGRAGGCVCSTATGAKPVPRAWSWRPRRLRHWLPGAPPVPACLSGSALSRSRGVGYLSHSTSSANACSENTSTVSLPQQHKPESPGSRKAAEPPSTSRDPLPTLMDLATRSQDLAKA
jgi:hypothetical protein